MLNIFDLVKLCLKFHYRHYSTFLLYFQVYLNPKENKLY